MNVSQHTRNERNLFFNADRPLRSYRDCREGRESISIKALYNVLKGDKNLMIQELINSSYEHCCREEMQILFGNGDLLDNENCGTESAAKICLVINTSFILMLPYSLQ